MGVLMSFRRVLLPVLLLPFLTALNVFAALNPQGSCTNVVLGPYSTLTYGVDNAGDVVGYYQNESGGNDGYLRTADGNETTIDYPGFAGATEVYGINNVGQAVGTAGGNVFIYDIASQTFADVNLQGMANTDLVAINDSGAVVGTFTLNGTSYGYLVQGSQFTKLLPPGTTSATAYGISRKGTVIGSATLPNGSTVYFSYSNGNYARVQKVPDLTAISPSATFLAGNTVNQFGDAVGLTRHANTPLYFECNGGETVALGVNESGQVAGFYGYIGDPFLSGFIWTPPPNR